MEDIENSFNSTQTGDADSPRALSVHYLSTTLLRELEAAGFSRRSTVHEIEARIIRAKGAGQICPRDGQIGCAYVDAVAGDDNVGRATHMLSYSWSYEIGDIIDALRQHCRTTRSDPKRTYVWTCCFGVNQHRVQDTTVPFEHFAHEFASRVRSIGHVLALMAPWQNPIYLKRAWCVFEFHVALQMGCTVEVLMPPSQAQDFKANLLQSTEGIRKFHWTLQHVKVEEAEATIPQDRQNILKYIEGGLGHSRVNELVSGAMLTWFAMASERELQRSLPANRRCLVVLLEGCPKPIRAHVGATILTGMGLKERARSYTAPARLLRHIFPIPL